ncbi:MAG: CYCXC family (seleno)protein [Gemmatimonadota bacterium]
MARSKTPWVIVAVAVVAIGALVLVTRSASAGRHPEPRPGITAADVLPPSTYAGYDQIVRAYEAAQQVPQVLDGLYCHCQCRENFNHRSLLSCFQSEHGASCDICMGEALMAAEMHRQGKTLEEIRQAVDARFRS